LLSKIFFPVLFISLITACSAHERDDLGKRVSDPTELTIGDIIRVVTVDIEDFRFRLTGITEQAIEGKGISIPAVKIREIEVITPVRSVSNHDHDPIITVLFIITEVGLILVGHPPSQGPGFGEYQ
jgi:hypothetical protein